MNLVSPLSGDPVLTTPTFVWDPLDGAAYYKLEVSIDGFSTIYKTYLTDNTRYTPETIFPSGKTYYWRVAMVDDTGNIRPFNDATIIFDPFPNKVYLPFVKR